MLLYMDCTCTIVCILLHDVNVTIHGLLYMYHCMHTPTCTCYCIWTTVHVLLYIPKCTILDYCTCTIVHSYMHYTVHGLLYMYYCTCTIVHSYMYYTVHGLLYIYYCTFLHVLYCIGGLARIQREIDLGTVIISATGAHR